MDLISLPSEFCLSDAVTPRMKRLGWPGAWVVLVGRAVMCTAASTAIVAWSMTHKA